MAFALLSIPRSKTAVLVTSKPKFTRGQRTVDSRLGFERPGSRLSPSAFPSAAVIQPKLKVGEPNDKFEQEADRVADEVMKMPEALPPGTAISPSASVYPSSGIQPHCIECVRGGGLCPQCVEKEKIESNTLTETATALIQRELGGVNEPNDQISLKEEDKKAELEFHSALHFNRTFSGFNPTGEPKEGEHPIIWWSAWNTGWKTAPEHTNRLTIYHADLCSGCRYEKDVFLRMEMPAPSIVSITQQGKSEYESAYFLPKALSAGHYDAYVELDVRNEVEEINEDNNSAFMVLDVRPRNESESAIEGEEETIRPKKDAGRAPEVGPDVASQISGLRGRGQPLPQSLRAFFGPRFGYDFSQVRIYSDARAAVSARNLQAKAFTIGRDIVFGAGQYALEKPQGWHLVAHELTHVIQQTGKSHFYGGESRLGVQRKPENECPRLISFTASGKDPYLSDKCKGECRFGLGCCPTERGKCGSSDTSGMIFKAVVRAEKNCKGELAFMQNLLSTNRKVTKSDGTEECKKADKPHRDGVLPWKGCKVSVNGPGEFTIISDDCPNRKLTDTPAGVSITDSFKTFLLWKSEGAGERRPIANVTWGWSGAITRAKGKECASQYKIVSASHTDGKGKASEEKSVTTPEVKDIKAGPCK